MSNNLVSKHSEIWLHRPIWKIENSKRQRMRVKILNFQIQSSKVATSSPETLILLFIAYQKSSRKIS